ncbi:hypothetical protein ISP15_10045 [Dyella jejuensis]|uniref:DUF904 domain-containing protein n=1 Tax=Dyella jejuensis TaxID=1432009 RepID=A0ABW8JHU6_9GAMM
MKNVSEQRLKQLERLCGQLLAQNHRLIERNARLLLEIQSLQQDDRLPLAPANVVTMTLQPRAHAGR